MSETKPVNCVERARDSMIESVDRTSSRISEVEEIVEYLWKEKVEYWHTRKILERCLKDLRYNHELQIKTLERIDNWEKIYKDGTIPLSELETLIDDITSKYIRMMRVENKY